VGAAGLVAVTGEGELGKVARRAPAEQAAWAASPVKEERPVAAASRMEAVLVPSAAALVAAVPVAPELPAAALIAAVTVVQEQAAAPEQVAAEAQVAVLQAQAAAPEQVAAEELAVPAAQVRAAAVVHRTAVRGCSTESP
jgi:hypothetical protein